MAASDPIVVVGAARTPIGGFLGELKDAPAPALGAAAIRAALARAGLDGEAVDEALMGYALSAGLGQAPPRPDQSDLAGFARLTRPQFPQLLGAGAPAKRSAIHATAVFAASRAAVA